MFVALFTFQINNNNHFNRATCNDWSFFCLSLVLLHRHTVEVRSDSFIFNGVFLVFLGMHLHCEVWVAGHSKYKSNAVYSPPEGLGEGDETLSIELKFSPLKLAGSTANPTFNASCAPN